MVVLPSGKRLNIRARRRCLRCGASTWHICYGIRYEKPEPKTKFYVKHLFWSCEVCGTASEETRQVEELSEQAMLVNRLLKVTEEYDLRSSTIRVGNGTVTFVATLSTS